MIICTCPTCGQPMNRDEFPVGALSEADMTPQQQAIIEVLIRAYPDHATVAEISAAIWGDDPMRFPRRKSQAIHVRMSQLRPILREYGWTIPFGKPGRRQDSSRYRLERIL